MSAVLSVTKLTQGLTQELAKHSAKKSANAETSKILMFAVCSFQQLVQELAIQSTENVTSAETTKALVSAVQSFHELTQEMAKEPDLRSAYHDQIRRLIVALCLVIMVHSWEDYDRESETDDSKVDGKKLSYPAEPSTFTKKLLAVARTNNGGQAAPRSQKRVADWLHNTPDIEPNKRIKNAKLLN